MSASRVCLILCGCLLAPMFGCTCLQLTPTYHLPVSPDYTIAWLLGDWQIQTEDEGKAGVVNGERPVWSVRREVSGDIKMSTTGQEFLVRAVPLGDQLGRCLIELESIKQGELDVVGSPSILAIASRTGGTLSFAPIDGDKLEEAMGKSEHSDVFFRDRLWSAEISDVNAMIRSIREHEAELTTSGCDLQRIANVTSQKDQVE